MAAKFVKCPKSYYTEQFEKYGYIRDKYDTTYNTPTPYDPSLVLANHRCAACQGLEKRACLLRPMHPCVDVYAHNQVVHRASMRGSVCSHYA